MPKLIAHATPLWAILALACADGPPVSPTAPEPQFAISDGVHRSGNVHFFFLPPMVAPTGFGGVFDPTARPAVEICQLNGDACALPLVAEFSMDGGTGSERVRLEEDAEQYIVNWHTGRFGLDLEATYRIRVLLDGLILGFADVDLLTTGREQREVDTADFIGVVNGSTLPIKFRIEEGALTCGTQVVVDANKMVMQFQAGVLPPGPNLSNGGSFQNTGILFGGGLVYGTSGTEVVVGYDPRGIAPTQLDLTSPVCAVRNGGDQQTTARVVPLTDFPSLSGLSITQRTFAFGSPPNDGFVLIAYTFTNTGIAPVDNLFAGLLMDWDLLYSGGVINDRVLFDSAFLIAQAFEPLGYPRVGLQANSDAPVNYAGFQNGIGPLGDPRTPAEFFALLSGGIRPAQVGPWDIRSLLSFGPTSIPPGGARTFTFALVGGIDQTEYMLSHTSARAKAAALGLF
jgi:hypothetical protein